MDDDIAHLGIVNSPLRSTPPCLFRGREVGEHADDVDGRQIVEVERLGIGDPTAENEVELAHEESS